MSFVKSFFIFSTLSTSVFGAGFQLSEYSATGLGRAFSGQGVVGDDFSAIGYNPAGMQILNKSGFQLGASTVGIRSVVKGETNYGIKRTGKTKPYIVRVLPEFFSQYKINEKTTVGVGLYTPFGLATDYDNDWFGNTRALSSEITSFDLSPSFSYQLLEKIAIGFSLNFQYTEATITNKHPLTLKKVDLQGDDMGVGYTVGIIYSPFEKTRLGVSYRSKIGHTLKGDLRYNGLKTPIYTKIITPETLTFSGHQKLNSQWGLSSTIRWTRWTRFKDLDIYQKSTNSIVSATHENWKNTWFYALGTDFKYNKNWTFRMGSAYDQTAISRKTDRTPRIPDGRRIWASVGTSYQSGNWQFDLGYAHLFIQKVKAQHSGDNLHYSSNANLFSLQAQYNF